MVVLGDEKGKASPVPRLGIVQGEHSNIYTAPCLRLGETLVCQCVISFVTWLRESVLKLAFRLVGKMKTRIDEGTVLGSVQSLRSATFRYYLQCACKLYQ